MEWVLGSGSLKKLLREHKVGSQTGNFGISAAEGANFLLGSCWGWLPDVGPKQAEKKIKKPRAQSTSDRGLPAWRNHNDEEFQNGPFTERERELVLEGIGSVLEGEGIECNAENIRKVSALAPFFLNLGMSDLLWIWVYSLARKPRFEGLHQGFLA